MMYDFEIVIPTEIHDPTILARIEDFKKIGFMNHEGYKIKLFLMASHRSDPTVLETGWPEGFDVEVIVTPFTHVAQRIYWYYARYIQPDRAKWYIRIDEDSITDIAGLDENLKLMFDHEREYHVCGTLNWDVWDIDESILRSLGYGHFYLRHHNHHENPPHEQEISVTSNGAIRTMFKNPDVKSYFEIRKEFPDGYGDHGLCHCMRMCKIYVLIVHFLTHQPELVNFSCFGGFKNHIHHVCRDMTPKIIDWLKIFSNKPCPEDDMVFLMGKRDERKEWVRFSKEKKILTMQGNHMIGIWSKTAPDILSVYGDNQHEPIAHFKKENETLWYYADNDWELIKTKIGN